MRERALHSLEIVGLSDRADHFPNQLSGGQQQRVAIARALVNDPEILLADEPTGNLDSKTSVEVMGVFQKLNDQGITIVMVTHELDIARYCKRNLILRDGRLVRDELVQDRLQRRRGNEETQGGRGGGETDLRLTMRVINTIKVALRALRRNAMRSILTALGIIIGVAAVIAMVSIGNGAKAQVEAQVASLGENVITVFPGSFTSGGMRSGWGSASTLTVDDADAIKREVADVLGVTAEMRDRAQVLANGLNWNTQIMGESPDYPSIRSWPIAEGAMFTDQDVRSVAKVAVLGKTVADQLFPDGDPLGKTIRIRNIPFKIVGMLAAKGFNLFGQDQDDTVVIPYTSHMKRVARRPNINSILVQAASAEAIDKRAAGHHRSAHAAPQGPRAGFHRAQPGGDRAGGHRDFKDDDAAARRRRRCVARRRRHRHHEHHACQRDGAHARDRHPPRRRRTWPRRAAAVPDRGGDPQLPGRHHRDRARRRRLGSWFR